MSDVASEKPCGCQEQALSAPSLEEFGLDDLEAALAEIEGGNFDSGEFDDELDLEFGSLDVALDDLSMTPLTAETEIKLEDVLALIENYPGLKLTMSF